MQRAKPRAIGVTIRPWWRRRRGFGEDSVYFDAANNRWKGAVSLDNSADGTRRVRRTVTGRTKSEVRDKLKALHRDLEGVIHSSPTYTMAACIEDWLSQGLADRSPTTVANYRYAAGHAVSKLGAVKLRDLTARHVQTALAELFATLSTRSLRLVHQVIERVSGTHKRPISWAATSRRWSVLPRGQGGGRHGH